MELSMKLFQPSIHLLKSWLLLLIIILLLFIYTQPTFSQVVSPFQTGHYTPAAQSVRDMSNPIPGFFPIWYNIYAYGNTFVDYNGNDVNNLNQFFPNLNVDVSLDATTFASIPMFFWASNKISFLGDASYLGGFSLNYVSVNTNFKTQRRGIINPDSTITKSEETTLSGFSDMFFLPLGLSWGLSYADITFTYGFATPTAKYETGADDNLGMGFWTHQFQTFGYYYPVADRSTAIMIGVTYEINTEIEDEQVKPGNRFSLEYGFSQYLTPRFEVAVQGGHNWQVSDDTGEGVYWDATKHDRKSTFAFYATYWLVEGMFASTLKYGHDYGARQRFLTNYWMLNFVYIPGILTGN